MAGPHTWIKTVPSPWEAASFNTGLLPGSNEEVYFDGTANGDVVSGLNQTAVDLDKLHIKAEYSGTIGAHGNPLIISADTVIHEGTGTLYYQDGGGQTDVILIRSTNLIDAAWLNGATFDRVRIIGGKVSFGSTFTCQTRMEIGDGTAGYTAIVDAENGPGADVPEFRMISGFLSGQGAYHLLTPGVGGYAFMSGGTVILDAGAPAYLGGVFVMTGGYLEWANYGSPGSVVQATQVELYGGTIDARKGNLKQILTLYKSQNAELLYTGTSLTITTTHPMEP